MTFQLKFRRIYLASLLAFLTNLPAHAGFFDDALQKTKNTVTNVIDKTVEKKANEVADQVTETESVESAPTETSKPEAPRYEKRLIADIQSELNRLGFSVGSIDGLYGGGTKRAIESFQQKNSLLVDGVPSEHLLAYMQKMQASVSLEDHREVTSLQKKANIDTSSEQVVSKDQTRVADRTSKKEKSSLPYDPQSAEETEFNFGLTTVRLRPELLEKEIRRGREETLFDLLLRTGHETLGIPEADYRQYTQDEFFKRKNHDNYKQRILNTAKNAPLKYLKKISTEFREYDFVNNKYEIRAIEIKTFYRHQLIGLFEGSKNLESIDMSHDEAENLKNWFEQEGRKGQSFSINGYWTYEIKSVKHISELRDISWAQGFVAEIEPGDMHLYASRPIPPTSEEIERDPMATWRRHNNPEYEHREFASLELSTLLSEDLFILNKFPPFDVVGVKLGQKPSDVISTIKRHNPKLSLKERMKRPNMPGGVEFVHQLISESGRENARDNFKFWFAEPPFPNVLIGINRDLRLTEQPVPVSTIESSLNGKYGKPDRSLNHGAGDNYAKELNWNDGATNSSMKAVLSVKDEEVVMMSLRISMNVSANGGSANDAKTQYERNQQLWRSYHSDDADINQKNNSLKGVKAPKL